MLRKQSEMQKKTFTTCHQGIGDVHAHLVLSKEDSENGVQWMHDDTLPPGVSIGEHRHDGSEEIYFVVEGHGTMILDGKSFPIGPGDVSVVHSGHTHGLINSSKGSLRLIVVCVSQALATAKA